MDKDNNPTFIFRDGMTADKEYVEWLKELKARYRQSQVTASVKVVTNLKYMRRWYAFYNESFLNRQQRIDELKILLICKTAKKTIVEWSLQDIQKPLGVATYQLQEVVDRTIAELEQKKK